MKYRTEIDGLRAVAVLSVILSHAEFAIFKGGYIGVDVFFVISGYLITRNMLDEYERGEFSLVRFYERRARRILPALFFVLFCTTVMAWMWLMPGAYRSFSKSLISAAFSVSNLHFLKQIDYFSPDSAEMPLLHTWSLGVEEQYYMLFPMLFLWRWKVSAILRGIFIVAAASFLISEAGSWYFPSANYYLLPSRAWELLAGSLCAFKRPRHANQILSVVGLAMITWPIFAFDASTRMPSAIGLLPVAGAGLFLLFSSRDVIAGRLLSTPPLVWMGKISFSAYLWHQPLFAFWRIRSPEPPSTIEMGGLCS
jgi:peptidoglycan/LPS O-acetylase OafA/YrhL